jgi:CRP-like cAMP-binding protein
VSQHELKRCALFEDFSDDERDTLWQELEPEDVPAGHSLFEEGSEADGLLVVLDGEVQVECRERGALGAVGAGAALGALSLVAAGRREATAVARTDCKLVHLSRGSFRRLVADAPQLACKLQEAMLRELAANLREGLPALRDGDG